MASLPSIRKEGAENLNDIKGETSEIAKDRAPKSHVSQIMRANGVIGLKKLLSELPVLSFDTEAYRMNGICFHIVTGPKDFNLTPIREEIRNSSPMRELSRILRPICSFPYQDSEISRCVGK